MTNMTYDPDADAAYIKLGGGTVAETSEVKPGLIVDYDSQGRILGIEILAASRAIAPGAWSKAPRPALAAPHSDAAE